MFSISENEDQARNAGKRDEYRKRKKILRQLLHQCQSDKADRHLAQGADHKATETDHRSVNRRHSETGDERGKQCVSSG